MSPKYRYPVDDDPATWNDSTRIGSLVDLLTSQDSVTWTIVSISFATQGILVGFYFQLAKGSGARGLLALVGLLVSLSFLLFIARSNRYMSYYMRLLSETRRAEFRVPPLWLRVLMWSEENAPTSLPYLERLVRSTGRKPWRVNTSQVLKKAASATALLYLVDGGWVFLWLLILAIGNLL